MKRKHGASRLLFLSSLLPYELHVLKFGPPHFNTINVLLHAIKSMHDSLNSLDHLINCSGWLGNLIIMLKMYYSAEKHA